MCRPQREHLRLLRLSPSGPVRKDNEGDRRVRGNHLQKEKRLDAFVKREGVPHGESEDPILPCLGTMYGRYLPEGRGSAGVQGIPPHFRFTRSSPSDSRRHLVSLSKYEGPGAISS